MKLPPFSYHRPTSLSQAVALLGSYDGDAKVIAGGQSLLPMMAYRLLQPRALIDICAIAGMDGIDSDPAGLRLGSRVRWVDILTSGEIATANPLLVAAVAQIAHYQVRNRGTVGGSLAHADPASEFPAVCLACGADILAVGAQGRRTIPASSFFHGALTTDLAEDEVIEAVRFPPWPENRHWGFREFSRRPGDFAMAGIALTCDLDEAARASDAKIVTFGVTGMPERLPDVEAFLAGRTLDAATRSRAGEMARDGLDATTDQHAPAEYRRALAGVLLERALTDLVQRMDAS